MMKPQEILVVDDDPDARSLLEYAFEMEAPELRVGYVSGGREAIEYLQGKPPYEGRVTPGLMLLDLKMPGVDGFEVLEWLRRCPEVRPEYVVVFTSSGEKRDMDRAWQSGADGYMVKPPSFDYLRDQVRVLAFYARNGQWPAGGTVGPEIRKRW